MSTVFASITTPGPPGPPGRSPLWLTGAVPPVPAQGLDGDMYLVSTNGDVYGPKASNIWGGIVANIRGATGATGAQGPAGYSPLYIVAAGPPNSGQGNPGDMYLNSTNSDIYGPKVGSSWGPIVANIKGATGAQGPPGQAYTSRGAWSAAVTYAQGDMVTDVSILYIALQSVNLNHVPLSSPTWWQTVAQGGSQTPWQTNIDGNSKTLNNAGNIGIGVGSGATAKITTALGTLAGPANSFLQPISYYGVVPNHDEYSVRLIREVPDTSSWTSAFWRIARFVDGNPSISSIDLGPYWISFNTAGTRKMSIDQNGNVTIGPSPTLTKLNVAIGAATDPSLTATTGISTLYATSGIILESGITAANHGVWLQSKFYSNDGRAFGLFLNPKGGPVGIGTTAPQGSYLSVVPVHGNAIDPAGAKFLTIGETTNSGGYYMSLGYYISSVWFGSIQALAGNNPTPLILNGIGGNVGIGAGVASTLAPAHNLHIKPGAGNATLMLESPADGAPIFTIRRGPAGADQKGWDIGAFSTGLLFRTLTDAGAGGVTWMSAMRGAGTAISSVQFPVSAVSIGNSLTALPSGSALIDLVVGGDAATAGRVTAAGNTGAASTAVGVFAFANYGTGVAEKRVGQIAGFTDTTANSGFMVFYTALAGTMGEKARLTSDGNFKLGTNSTNPAQQLTIIGPGVATTAINTAVRMGGTLTVDDEGTGYGNGGAILFGAYSGAWRYAAIKGWAVTGTGNSQGMLFFCVRKNSADATLSEAMRIDETGKVGIGAIAPTHPLTVNGDCNLAAGSVYRINGVPISTSGGFTNMAVYTSGQRPLGQIFQNQTGKLMFVSACVFSGAGGGTNAYSDATTNPGTQVAAVNSSAAAAYTVTFWVFPLHYYKLLAGSATFSTWVEYT